MMKKATDLLRVHAGPSRSVKRALLLTAGAVLGAVVSVTASYALVSALYPRQAAPAALAATQPNVVLPARIEPEVVLSVAPTAPEINVTPLETIPAPVETVAVAPVPRPAMPAPVAPAAPEAEVVFTSKSVADIALPAPDAPETAGEPVTFGEAQPSLRPEPRPEIAIVVNEAAIAALSAPDMPSIRPAPRPDVIPAVATLAEAPALAEDIPNMRPAPRPDIVRVSSAQPAAEAPAPRRSGSLFSGAGKGCGTTLARAIPRRSGNAPGGNAFFAALGGLSGTERDARVVNELARGNMPAFLRHLQPVTFRGKDGRGVDTEIVICVTPDYLALGSDSDYVRVPLGLPAAAQIAGRFDMTLPTPRMVDAIYAQADVKLSPAPMQAGPQMSSTTYFLRHNATIEGQLGGRGGLVAGQKKDVVMASRMANNPGRVAIYGWHRSATSPIQPVSTVHGATYADYSHGIRLVSKTAYLNGRAVNLDDLLGSSRYAYLLNSDGPLPGPVIRTASR